MIYYWFLLLPSSNGLTVYKGGEKGDESVGFKDDCKYNLTAIKDNKTTKGIRYLSKHLNDS